MDVMCFYNYDSHTHLYTVDSLLSTVYTLIKMLIIPVPYPCFFWLVTGFFSTSHISWTSSLTYDEECV